MPTKALAAVLAMFVAAPAALGALAPLQGLAEAPWAAPAAPEDDDGHEASHAAHRPDRAPHEGAHSHARERTGWPPAEGRVPASPQGLREVRGLLIEGAPDLEALAADGVGIQGKGTLASPFVIEGLHVRGVLELKDTDHYYVVRENWIARELRLNWNGDKVHVHHNYVNDLRVNENRPRSGDSTAGLIELNAFGIVGQIRHFDGVFRANQVGPAPAGPFRAILEDSGELVPWFQDQRVLNIDGFDGAVFEENVVVGYIEMQLHGHHHASCFACHSHNHGDPVKAAKHDHSIRYHEAVFRDNRVTVERGVAFRYTDAGHAGDDRTAASEPEESLRGPHVHYTDVLVAGNTLVGGPLVVDVFNADDRYHDGTVVDAAFHGEHRGVVALRGNVVRFTLPDQTLKAPWLGGDVRDGLLVRTAREAAVVLEANEIVVENGKSASAISAVPLWGEGLGGSKPAGVALRSLQATDVVVRDNVVRGTHFGVLARSLDEDTTWTLSGNVFRDVRKPVDHDASVANGPDEG